jgi:hypothetical protein
MVGVLSARLTLGRFRVFRERRCEDEFLRTLIDFEVLVEAGQHRARRIARGSAVR